MTTETTLHTALFGSAGADTERSARPVLPSRGQGPIQPLTVLCERFQLRQCVERTAAGSLYLARDLSQDDEWVMLQLLGDRKRRSPAFFKRLEAAFGQALMLEHTGIVRVHALYEDRDIRFVTMDAIVGEALSRVLEHLPQPLSLRESGELLNDMGRALAYAHRQGVVHGCFGAPSILVTPSLDVRVTNFSYLAAATTDRQTGASVQQDCWALACVFYEMVSGSHPFGGTPLEQVVMHGLKVAPVDGLTDDQWSILERALAPKHPDQVPDIDTLIGVLGHERTLPRPEPAGAPPWQAESIPETATQSRAESQSSPPAVQVPEGEPNASVAPDDTAAAAPIQGPGPGHSTPPILTETVFADSRRKPRGSGANATGHRTFWLIAILSIAGAAYLTQDIWLGKLDGIVARILAMAPNDGALVDTLDRLPIDESIGDVDSSELPPAAQPQLDPASDATVAVDSPVDSAEDSAIPVALDLPEPAIEIVATETVVAPAPIDDTGAEAPLPEEPFQTTDTQPASVRPEPLLVPTTAVLDTPETSPPAPKRGRLRFTSGSIAAGEDAGGIRVPIERIGGSAGAIQFAWWTEAGTATPEDDYAYVGRQVEQFDEGETARQISLPIADDALIEGHETVHILLQVANGKIARKTLIILDDD